METKKNNLIIGFLVLNFFETDGAKRLHIIDFLLTDTYKLTDLLRDIECKFRDVNEMVLGSFNDEIDKVLLHLHHTDGI